MAQVTPPISQIRALSASEHTELELLRLLADGLPDRYELFHGVDWNPSDPHPDHRLRGHEYHLRREERAAGSWLSITQHTTSDAQGRLMRLASLEQPNTTGFPACL